MPIYLKPLDDLSMFSDSQSVLIVPCPVCPAISMAIQDGTSYMKIFRSFLRTPVFQTYLKTVRRQLEEKGIRIGIFESYFPMPLMCMWLPGQRKRLLKRACDYDGVAVPGCDAAAFNVSDALKSTNCKVVQLMQVEGIVTAIPRLGFPFNVNLEIPSHKSVSWPKRLERGSAEASMKQQAHANGGKFDFTRQKIDIY